MTDTKTSEGLADQSSQSELSQKVSHAPSQGTGGRRVLPKTDARYWQDKVFTRTNEDYNAQIAFGGKQERWPLKTANRAQAASKARDIYLSLIRDGYGATRAKFKPWTVAPEPEPTKPVTVGDFIQAVKTIAPVRPTTFTTYERKLRFLASQISNVKGTKERHDYVHGGAQKWRDKVDNFPLAALTPEKVMQWRVAYLKRFDAQPLKRQSAQQTVASILRSAKALFSPKLIRNLALPLPRPLPFDGVDLGKRPRTRYKSKVNAPLLVKLAHDELKDYQPELFKIFLLAFAAGLRRGEIDRLTWKQFDWRKGVISIEATEHGVAKTEASNEEIDIGEDLVRYFRAAMAQSKSEFVIASKAAPTAAPHWNRYRCDGHFKALLAWLRSKDVNARNPLHTLRKEFGSLINQKFGIFAASAALRHSSIAVTREHYVDRKERIALDLAEVLQQAEQPQPKPAALKP
jgi:integrase